MRKTVPRRTIYAATIVAILAIVSGYALASLTIGSFSSTPGQNAVSGNQVSIPGVTFPAEQVILAGTSPTTSGCSAQDPSLNTPSSADTLGTSGAAALCLNTGGTVGSGAAYGAGDFIQVVEVEFSATGGFPAGTYFSIQVYLDGASNTGNAPVGLPTNPVTAYVMTPSGWGSGDQITEWLTFDMTSSVTSSLTTINVIVTDCQTSVCTF